MLPSQHAVVGIIAAVLLYPIFGIDTWMIAAAAVLIDVDHYFIYIYRKKSLNIKDAYWFFRSVKDGSPYYPAFHMAEIIALEAVFVYYYPIFLPILIGQIIHVAQDWVEENFSRRTTRNFSLIKLLYKQSLVPLREHALRFTASTANLFAGSETKFRLISRYARDGRRTG